MTSEVDDLPLFRATDSATSRQAAQHAIGKRAALQAAILGIVDSEPRTASEIAAACAVRHGGIAESYRKRMHELVRAGQVGAREPRVCSVTGRMAATYVRRLM